MAGSLKEIAKASGVSVATAARFLNGEQKEVWASTARRAQRVRDIAKQMGYRPNHRAKSLARKRSMAIGLLYGREGVFYGDLYHRVITRISEKLAHRGYDLMMMPAVGPASQWSAKLMDDRVDACIVTNPVPKDFTKVIHDVDLPMLGINLDAEGDFSHIRYNEAQGIELIMDHLFSLRHQRIWHAAYDKPEYKSLEHPSFVTRLQTIKQIMSEKGLSESFHFSNQPLNDLVDQILAMPISDRPTAIIAQTDTRAMQLIQIMADQNISIPKDISIVAFNNDIASEFFVPALTTIDLPVNQAADTAVSHLLDYLENSNKDKQTSLEPLDLKLDEKLIVRRSTAIAKA